MNSYRTPHGIPTYRPARMRRDRGLLDRIRSDVRTWFPHDEQAWDEQAWEAGLARGDGYGDEAYYADPRGNRHERNLERHAERYDEPYEEPKPEWYDDAAPPGPSRFGAGRFDDDPMPQDLSEMSRASDRYGRNRYGSWPRRSVYADRRSNPEAPGPHAGAGPKGYRRSAERLREEICERLAEAGDIDASDVSVDVREDEVTLTGTVTDRIQKRRVEACADSVAGVHDVHNRLTIHGSGGPDAG